MSIVETEPTQSELKREPNYELNDQTKTQAKTYRKKIYISSRLKSI